MKKSIPWLAAATIITIVFATIFVAVQQAQRQAAYDPQIQMAEDTAAAINQGTYATDPAHIEIASSLHPFIIVYGINGSVKSGTGYLHGALPEAPIGMLRAARNRTYSTVTWQPDSNVRIAAVTVATRDGYVVAGRSLTEVEKRAAMLFRLVTLGWLAAMLTLGGAFVLARRS